MMMKRVTLLAALATACLVAFSYAAVQQQQVAHVSGIVLAVNSQTHRIAVKQAGLGEGEVTKATFEFVVEAGSQITKNGQSIDLTNIKTGDPVTVAYTISMNQKMAQSIEVLTSPTM
jgi:Cu/Ag efflux protein CusF